LLFTKGGLTDTLFFYTIEAATPESLDALRRMFEGEKIEDLNIATWSASREAVAENDYNLVPSHYEPPPPGPPLEELWADMELIEEELARAEAELREMMISIIDFDEVERLKGKQRSRFKMKIRDLRLEVLKYLANCFEYIGHFEMSCGNNAQ